MDRKERIRKAYAYLRSRGIIHNQKDLSDAMESTPSNISKALNGDPSFLTDNFCRRIQKNLKVISAEWLISGTGEMVVIDSKEIATEQLPLPDYSSLMNAAIAAKDETIASLKRELEAKDETAASMKRELETKDALIASLRQQVSELGYTISVLKEKSTVGYAFPMGIAEPDAADPCASQPIDSKPCASEVGTIATGKNPKPAAKFPSKRK